MSPLSSTLPPWSSREHGPTTPTLVLWPKHLNRDIAIVQATGETVVLGSNHGDTLTIGFSNDELHYYALPLKQNPTHKINDGAVEVYQDQPLGKASHCSRSKRHCRRKITDVHADPSRQLVLSLVSQACHAAPNPVVSRFRPSKDVHYWLCGPSGESPVDDPQAHTDVGRVVSTYTQELQMLIY